MSRILGLDYGFARIGLAVSDENRCMALPLKTIPGSKSIQIAVQNVKKALLELPYPIATIVLGHPLHLSGKPSAMSAIVEEFKTALEKECEIPIVLFDERLSSSHADRSLQELQMNRKRRAKNVDVVAASLVLQSYLDQQRL